MNDPQPPKPLPPGASPRSGKPPPVATRWKPGQSGNPGGRPKGLSVTAALREILKQDHNGKALSRVVAERWLKDALSGKAQHLQMLLDRTEGAVGQRLHVERDDTPQLSGALVLQAAVLSVPVEYGPEVVRRFKEIMREQGKQLEGEGDDPP